MGNNLEDKSYESNPYDYHIAKAARKYINELIKYERGENVNIHDKLNILRWLIIAEENGWNPNIYLNQGE